MNKKTIQDARDVQFIKSLFFPAKYKVTMGDKTGEIRCVAQNGGLDESRWESFTAKCRTHFGVRLQEFYHEVNYRHKDFTVYLKNPDFSKVGDMNYLK